MNTFTSLFATSLLRQSPSLIFYLVGITICLIRWGRHANICALALTGLCICLLGSFGFSGVFAWLSTSGRNSIAVSQMSSMYMALGIASGLIHALGFAFVLAAVFIGRGDNYQPGFAVETRPRDLTAPPPMPPYRPPGH